MKLLIFISLLCFTLTGCQPKSQQNSEQKTETKFVRNFTAEPESLHPIRSTDAYGKIIHDHVLDSLLKRNINTFKWDPYLAEKWEVSKDGKIFTFTLRKGGVFHDGKPITTEDVLFSFNAFKDPAYGGARFVSYFENFKSAVILDNRRIQFKAHTVYFKNLETLGEILRIIPRHIYKDKDKKLNNTITGSGPYRLEKYNKGKQIVLRQNKNWWGRKALPDSHRIHKIVFKFIENENDQLIRIAGGDLDFINLLSESYYKKTDKAPWGDTVLKKKIKNKKPAGYSFIAWNLKNPLFQDKKVRKALAHLANRKLMNDKFQHGQAVLAAGPWYPWSDYADPSVPAVSFNPELARQMLKQAGWEDTDKNGVLDKVIKNKKTEFRFTLIFPTKDFEKYLTIYQQDLKKSGVIISLRYMDWPAFIKRVQEKQFSATALAWTGVMDVDPKQVWHSESAQTKGSNFISYSNPQVDRLIDLSRKELNKEKRTVILQKIYRIIADECPYLFMFSSPVQFYAHSNKVHMEKDTYTYGVGLEHWQIKH